MGACAGLIKSALKRIFRLWTDVHFVEICARWRLQATLLEVIVLSSLLAEPLLGSRRLQPYISGGDGWRGHQLPDHTGRLGTAPPLLMLQSESPGLFGQNRPGWPVWWEYESSCLLWFIVSDKECGALTGQWTMGTRDKLGLARLALEEAPCLQPSCARVGAETCPPAEATWTRSFGQWQGTQLHWAAHLPRSRHRLELGPWGVMKDCQTSPIQTRKLVSSSCCIFTKCVNVCTDKVWHNADQVWWAASFTCPKLS